MAGWTRKTRNYPNARFLELYEPIGQRTGNLHKPGELVGPDFHKLGEQPKPFLKGGHVSKPLLQKNSHSLPHVLREPFVHNKKI